MQQIIISLNVPVHQTKVLSFIKSLLLLAFTIQMSALAYAKENDKYLSVLAIHSYHQSYPWTASQFEAFKNKLSSNLPEYTINISAEYLDTKWITPSQAYKDNFLHYLYAKYKNNLPDLIYVTDDNALNFIHSRKNILSWNSPVIFSGINNTKISPLNTHQTVTGVFEYKDIQASISLANIINESSSKIYFLGDGGTTDKAIKKIIQTSNFETNGTEIINLSYSNINTIINKLNTIDDGTVILTTIGGIHNDGNVPLDLKESIKAITNTGKKILVMEDSYLLPEIIGGHVTSSRVQGESAADIASDIIRGKKAKNIKTKKRKSTEFILSWPELQRFDIRLPPNILSKANIINKPLPFLQRHPEMLKLLAVFVLILILVLTFSMYYANRKRRLLIEQSTDSLTGLPNRVKLLSDINKSPSPSLMILDINNFKSINNLYGLEAGDKLLYSFAKYTQKYINDNCQLYRISGDRFAILCSQFNPKEETTVNIEQVLKNIQNHCYHIDNIDISLTLTAGINRNKKEFLIPKAEQALQKAKDNNKEYFIAENTNDDADIHKENLLWAQKISTALAEDRIVPYFQLIMHNQTGKKSKFEALVRIIDEDNKIISPFYFLEAAKSTRQYASLTKIMIEKTFSVIENKEIEASINFTVEDIRDNFTIKFFKEKLNEYQVANQITVELTESEGIENYAEIAEFIHEIKQLGCRVAIDDFGTGYSNFTHLIHLNVDYLKIDGSIIKNIIRDKNAEIVTKTLVQFSKQLGIETVAEFVDSKEIFDKVKELGIDYSQGNYLAEPKREIN